MIESDEERAGILNWLIEGYTRRQSRTATGFDGERSVAEKEDMWSAYGTSIERFAATCITTDDATNDDAIASSRKAPEDGNCHGQSSPNHNSWPVT